MLKLLKRNHVFLLGGTSENFQFKIDDFTEVYCSCSSLLNDELFLFGGSNLKRQVNGTWISKYKIFTGMNCYVPDIESDWL